MNRSKFETFQVRIYVAMLSPSCGVGSELLENVFLFHYVAAVVAL